MSVRAFFAVDLPEPIRLDLAKAISRRLPPDVKAKCVAAENLHVTMHFLGDTPDDRIMAAHAVAQRPRTPLHPALEPAHDLAVGDPGGHLPA